MTVWIAITCPHLIDIIGGCNYFIGIASLVISDDDTVAEVVFEDEYVIIQETSGVCVQFVEIIESSFVKVSSVSPVIAMDLGCSAASSCCLDVVTINWYGLV